MTMPRIKKAPKKAAILMVHGLDNIRGEPRKLAPKTTKATPNDDPELIPNTYGPARGFLKTLCIYKPLSERPDPLNKASRVLGALRL